MSKKPTPTDEPTVSATVPATAPAPTATAPDERQPLPVPEGGWPADEYTGKCGSYVRDPYTGTRTPAPE